MNYGHASITRYSEIQITRDKRNAFHLAGHAAAIYLGNRKKQLPPVYFQINLNEHDGTGEYPSRSVPISGKHMAKIEGGRLIQSLPFSFADFIQHLSWAQRQEYQSAFEADVFNLLTGAMAEVHYSSLRYGEFFNADRVYQALQRSDGFSSDLHVINEYLQCLSPDGAGRKHKFAELFLASYRFVNETSNWSAVTALADYICGQNKGVIPCEDVIALLDSIDDGITTPYQPELPGFFARR